MSKSFNMNCKKANFVVADKQLIISPNETSLTLRTLNEQDEYCTKTEYYSYPEVAIVANLIKKLGFSHREQTVNGQVQHIFELEEGLSRHLLQGLITISLLQDLITVKESLALYNKFMNASNVNSHCNFFANNADEVNMDAFPEFNFN